jgi:hypothetical protein
MERATTNFRRPLHGIEDSFLFSSELKASSFLIIV